MLLQEGAPIAIAGQVEPLVPYLQQLHEPPQPADCLIVEADAETTGVRAQVDSLGGRHDDTTPADSGRINVARWA